MTTSPVDSNGDFTGGVPVGVITYSGVFALLANYSGDSQFAPASIQTAIATSTGSIGVSAGTLTCAPYKLYAGQPGSCTFKTPSTGATGTVAFSIGGNNWQTVPLDATGTATATNGFLGLTPGIYTVQATYSGDQNFASFPTTTSEAILSSQPLPSTIVVSCLPAPVTLGSTGSCQVTVGGGASGYVGLYVNNQQVGSPVQLNSTGVASFPGLFSTLPVGIATVSAVYLGDSNFASVTGGSSVTISDGQSTPTMAVACTPSTLTQNQTGVCSAQLTPGATGQVNFTVDGTPWTTASPDPSGLATTPPGLQTLAPGTHAVVASYQAARALRQTYS